MIDFHRMSTVRAAHQIFAMRLPRAQLKCMSAISANYLQSNFSVVIVHRNTTPSATWPAVMLRIRRRYFQ